MRSRGEILSVFSTLNFFSAVCIVLTPLTWVLPVSTYSNVGVTGQYHKAGEKSISPFATVNGPNQTRSSVMKTTIAAVLLATAIASPAYAQSYDPSVGSGNIVQPSAARSLQLKLNAAQGAYAQVGRSGTVLRRSFDNNYVGTDPDPNIRFQLNREAEHGRD